MTTKVKQTEIYKNSQGEHIVCKGELILIEDPKGIIGLDIITGNRYINGEDWKYTRNYKPIIISKTEKIEVGDKFLDSFGNIRIRDSNDVEIISGDRKILVLPENFSPKHLQAIIDGKLKDGDKVYVKCYETNGEWMTELEECPYICDYEVALINNHIKLFPVNKEENWNDISNNWNKFYTSLSNEQIQKEWKKGIPVFEWLKENYNLPTKK